MTMDELRESFPNLAKRLPENILGDHELVVVDYNYKDIYDEEVEDFDPDEYNHMIYIAEPISKILGEDGLKQIAQKIESDPNIESFLSTESDLYGVMAKDMNKESLSRLVFEYIDKILA